MKVKFHTRSCSAKGCGVKKYAGSEVVLHRFPSNVNRCRLWLERAKNPKLYNIPIEKVCSRAFLCEKHFRHSQYKCLERRELIHGAVPSIFPSDVENNSLVASTSITPTDSKVMTINCSTSTLTDVCDPTNSSEMKYCCPGSDLSKDTVSIFEQGVTLELSLAKINSDQQLLTSGKSNFQVQGSNSISSTVYRQLLFSEDTFKYESPSSENKNINHIATPRDSSVSAKSHHTCWKLKQHQNVSKDIIEHDTAKVVLIKNESRISGENLEVIKQSEPFLPLRRLRWKLKKYSCIECKIKHNTSQELRQHHRQYHTPRYPCRFCPRTMSFRKELDRHELCHITGKKHKCRRCPESYDTTSKLNQHRIAKHMDNPPFRCETCNKPYFQEHIYLQHVKLHSLGNRFLCEMCGKAFKGSSCLFAHRKMYCENPVEKKLSCEFCGKMYYHKSHLKVHVRTHTGEKPYLCSICGKGYRTGCRLKYHLDTHSVSKHACSFCGQLFLHKPSAKRHLKRHGNCRVCFLVFGKKIKQHLLHRREFHAAEVEDGLEKGFGGEKLVEFADGGGKIGDFSKTVVKCEKCTRNFASVFWLRSHQKGGCIDQPIFKCPICEKIAHSEDSYKRHMLLHSENNSHQCSHCLQTFNIYQDLVEHEKEHGVPKPYSCLECGKCFRSSKYLSKHLITHSKGRVYFCTTCDESFSNQLSLLMHKCKYNTQSEVSPCSISIKKSSQQQLTQKYKTLEEQKYLTENISMCNEDHILNISEKL